ncbi:hypothetical protein EXE53_21195 [Halorubrum sp. SD626R]|uniref:hypothetical protein n=1 Tax=Halorubrum sp. SD626R TaxID=1419722 RepID=UPI0010F844C9|nr:hypothetical protein [Halorubrum sp. SD626R]TKX78440.1 hypothetical protein EXE53_21195 [Halorubrum sp. SD626R]
MAVIDLDSEPDWVEDAWNDQEGELRLRDAVKPKHRAITVVALACFAATGLLAAGAVESFAAGDTMLSGLVLLATAAFAYMALLATDELQCQLSAGHECRKCREETARWEGDS